MQNWGYVLYKPEQSVLIRSRPTDYAFVEHEVVVQGVKTHLFCIQHDPGNARYAYTADDIWNITHMGYTRPNPVSIGNIIETLLSLWCLAPVFPEIIGRLGTRMHIYEEQVAERNATRAARTSWFGGKKGKGSSQGGKAPGHWGADNAEGSDEGPARYPQGSKGPHSWG